MGHVVFGDNVDHVVSETYSPGRGDVLRSEHIEVTKIRFARGDKTDFHAHGEEQFMFVLSGRLRLTLEDETYEVAAGEATFNPSNARHLAEALEDTVALSFKAPLVSDVYRATGSLA